MPYRRQAILQLCIKGEGVVVLPELIPFGWKIAVASSMEQVRM